MVEAGRMGAPKKGGWPPWLAWGPKKMPGGAAGKGMVGMYPANGLTAPKLGWYAPKAGATNPA